MTKPDTCCVCRNGTLKLAGNSWCVQQLHDQDVHALIKCLRHITCVTGEPSGSGEQLHQDALHSSNIFISTGLDVSYNNITDEGVRLIADFLQVGGIKLQVNLIFSHTDISH